MRKNEAWTLVQGCFRPTPSSSLISDSTALPLGSEVWVSYCGTRVLSGIHPHTADWDLFLMCVYVCEGVCECVHVNAGYYRSSAIQEKAHKISCSHLPPDRLSTKCFSLSESGTRVCECVHEHQCVCMAACPLQTLLCYWQWADMNVAECLSQLW